MKAGKVPEAVLKRSVFKQIKHRRDEVLVRPGIGEDCAILEVGADEVIVLSTDPITGTANEIGTLAVHITANDIAAGGADLIGIMLVIILPEGTKEAELKDMMCEVEEACKDLAIEIIGGHTEISKAVKSPVVTVTGVGKMKKNNIITTSGLKPGQELVMTKWAGIEGTAILAREKMEQLKTRYSMDFIARACDFINDISVVKDAKAAREIGVSAMHDITEGGIFGALWEMACASGIGVKVDLKKIPIRQETVEICNYLDINPYLLISSGSLLIGTEKGNEMAEALRKEGINASVIGKAIPGNDKIIVNGDEIRYLEPPKSDELYKALNE